MGVNKKSQEGVMHVSLYSGDWKNRPFTEQELKF